MNRETYAQKHPGALVKCQKTFDRYSNQNKENGNWIQRRRDDGDDLMDYRKKMGEAVSSAIMSNTQERERRSKLLGELNKRDDARERSRNTAIKTSARPEIIKQRTKRLIEKAYKPTLGEQALIVTLKDLGFVWNRQIHDSMFINKSQRRQVDFMNHEKRFLIEFDGRQHFVDSWRRSPLEKTHTNDLLLDEWVRQNNCVLVRVGFKQFNYKTKKLSERSESLLLNAINDNLKSGTYFIGDEYVEFNHPTINCSEQIT